jgi:hypothetical protein
VSDFENRARAAGDALRDWTPDGPVATPDAAVRRAVHRTRVHRATAGGLLAVALGGVGLLWGPGGDGDDVDISPQTSIDDLTTTTEAPEPTTSTTPTTAAPDPVEPVETTTTTAPTTTTAEAPVATSCTGQVAGTAIGFTATVPAGWHTNESAMGEPACHHFGPAPIELRPTETEAGVGVASNAVVQLFVSQGPGAMPVSFDEWIDTRAGQSNVTGTRRTTVDGHPAARFELVTGPGDDVPQGGDRYVHWMIDLGDVWFDAVTTLEPGVTYEESVAAIDQIVASLDFTA